jgi:hypothetical protein
MSARSIRCKVVVDAGVVTSVLEVEKKGYIYCEDEG